MKKRKNWDSHIWLYAKHWYKRTHVISDLKKILADRSGIDKKCINIDDIFNVLCNIVLPYLTEYKFINFLQDSFKTPLGFEYKRTTTLNKVFERLLFVLYTVSVKDEDGNVLIELDEPDYTILPKREDIC